MVTLRHVPASQFRKVLDANAPATATVAAFAALCRLNTLYMVRRAGSGHLGTSFSSQDIIAWLFLREMRLGEDVFFSSKGHDAPALYSVLTGLGLLDFERIHTLRRLGGLPGHPDVSTPRVEVNSGSLGMGISKAKGIANAHKLLGKPGRVFVLTGDGELQEGQVWESLGSAAQRHQAGVQVIVDCNKIQSDTWVHRVSDPRQLPDRWRAFGWHVERCDGHDPASLERAFASLREVRNAPKVLFADTVKGKGVSFMEEFGPDDKFYGFHSGAPDDAQYERAFEELRSSAEQRLREVGLDGPAVVTDSLEVTHSPQPRHRLVDVYSREIVRHAEQNPRLVALDADLIKDCGLSEFAARFPERLIECGIAEQDMVSQAGGLALKGLLPVCHSFAAFLSARPNEQIYNNASERTKVVYTATLAGLLPGTPGHSHQAVRDVSALAAVPGLVMIAPATEPEVAWAVDFCLNGTAESSYLRLSSIPCIIPFPVSAEPFAVGQGRLLTDGPDGVLFAYGPVMLAQAWWAAERLESDGLRLRIVNMPWLNRVDTAWLRETTNGMPWVFTLDDHYVSGGQGDMLLANLAEIGWPSAARARRFGVSEIPVCGQNDEVLRHHGLDADCLVDRISAAVRSPASC